MKIVDANVLLYSVNGTAAHHQRARNWLAQALMSTEAVGLPWVSQLAFVRISTNPRVFDRPLTVPEAFSVLETWLDHRSVVIPAPTARHPGILRSLLERHGTGGNLTADAHLAALATELGAEIVTFDRDFARFDVRCTLLT